MSSGIEFDGVSFAYSDKYILRDISVTLDDRRVGIIGANGSGKSTFVRLINGLLSPTSGTVTVRGKRTDKQAAAVRRDVGFVFPDPDAQIVMPTVAEDIGFSLRRRKLSKPDRAAEVRRIADAHGLSDLLDHPAYMLSSGQKQLLAFASVRACQPKVLVCDEPTTLLDLANTARVMRMLEEAEEQVIVATHALEMLLSWARVLVIDGGAMAFDGPGEEAVAFYRRLVLGGSSC